jgi:hypothetical protein
MSEYKLIENDVRLMRRILVALQYKDQESADLITEYLRHKGLDFILPEEQTGEILEKYLARLQMNEIALALEFGCIPLPDYDDCIFLNSKWKNPRTLYVRLSFPVPELGWLGQKYWSPEMPVPEGMGEKSEYYPEQVPEKVSIWDKIKGLFK